MTLTYVPRSDWGARYDAGFGARDIPCTEGWLHHSATLAPDLRFEDLNQDSLDDDEVRAMQYVERIGQQRFGGGFSYNIAGMPSGRLYVGCGVRRVGAHTAKRNTRALGVVLIGDYSNRDVPQPLQDALVGLLQDAKELGWLLRPAFNGGHRDAPGAETACPGNRAHRLIPVLNRRAAGLPVRPVPTPTPAPTPTVEDDMTKLYLDPDGQKVWAVTGTGLHHIPSQDALSRGRRLGYYPNQRPTPISATDLGELGLEFDVAVDEIGQDTAPVGPAEPDGGQR